MDSAKMKENTRYAATIGFFDGVHRGHRYLIDHLCAEAQQRGLQSMVVTFDKHPRQVLQQAWQPQLLTTTDEKAHLLTDAGVDRVAVLPFTREMAALSAREFMQWMHDQLQVDYLLVGYDHRFGHNREETPDDYAEYGRAMGMEVALWQPLLLTGKAVSSSLVRRLLAEGKVAEAAEALGRSYQLSGTIGHGRQVGRQLGYPTANLVPDETGKMVPANGVYAVLANIGDETLWCPAMMNIGTCPTFGGSETTLETHVIDYSGDLYNQRLTVRFVAKLRDEMAFSSPEALAMQLKQDRDKALIVLK